VSDISAFCIDAVIFVALVAELRMLSSGESSAMVSNPAVVKPERHIKPDREALVQSLLEPGVLLNEASQDNLVTAVEKLLFCQPVVDIDACRWKCLGYWLCCQLASLVKPLDIFSRTSALEMITHISGAFLENLHGIRHWYSILPENDSFCTL